MPKRSVSNWSRHSVRRAAKDRSHKMGRDILDRELRVIRDTYVDAKFGTGVVKVTLDAPRPPVPGSRPR